MEVFRISMAEHAGRLTASGSPNRWNKRGQYVIYTGSSRALSTLELVVHQAYIIPSASYKILVISFPDDKSLIKEISFNVLPENWRTLAAYPLLQELGASWYESNETLVLKVPSVIIPKEFNYIINTKHPDFDRMVHLVRREDFFWDERLL